MWFFGCVGGECGGIGNYLVWVVLVVVEYCFGIVDVNVVLFDLG